MDDDDLEMTEEELELLLADLESNDPNSLFYECLTEAHEEALQHAGLTREDASLHARAHIIAACEINTELGVDELLSNSEHQQKFEEARAAQPACCPVRRTSLSANIN
jgi:hypothetical protein